MNSKRVLGIAGVSAMAAVPAGGFLLGLLNAGDPDPNPIGRVVHACMMAVLTPWHAGFPPRYAAGTGAVFNAWPHIVISFLVIFGGLVYREWKCGKRRSGPTGVAPSPGAPHR